MGNAASAKCQTRFMSTTSMFHVRSFCRCNDVCMLYRKTDQITEKLESLQREHDKVSDRMKATEDQKALLHQKLNATEISLESTKK